jgi:serine protease Do
MKRNALTGLLILMAVIPGVRTAAQEPDNPLVPPYRPDFREVIRHAKGRVFPAVVFIKCLRESHELGRRTSRQVSGSGVIISPDGEVLTNWHVVDRATEVRCLLFDGQALEARIVGSDKDTDLALLQLLPASLAEEADAPSLPTLPYALIGDSTVLLEGDFVMAMGAPWGLNRSVSIGIISCSNRFLPEHGEYSLWLQTDAASVRATQAVPWSIPTAR